MFKKIIAVLCAATMSMSTISSVGAAGSTGTVKLDQNLINLINQDDQNDQNNNIINNQDNQNDQNDQNNNIINNQDNQNDQNNNIINNQDNQDNQNDQNNNMGMMNNIMNMMLLKNKQFNNELIQSLFEDIKNNDLEKHANCTIYSDLKNILDNLKKMGVMENPEKNQRFIKQFLKNQLTRLGFDDLSSNQNNNMNMMNNINQINQCLQMCMLTQQNYMSNKNFEKFNFNIKNIQKNNDPHFQELDSKIMNDNALKDNISKIRNNMLKKVDPSETALETKFSNKLNEFNRKKEEVKIFAQHKLIDPAPAEKIEQNCITDIFALDLNGNFMEPEIKILDDYISKIDKFISGNDFTVANSDMSRLEKTYADKFDELQALIENAKMNNPFFSFTKEYEAAKNFINLIDWRADRELLESNLEEAIKKLDDAIKSIKPFSMGVVSKPPYLEWQDQAHNHIDELFNDAINKMQTSANQFSIDNIKQEFDQYLCGQQKHNNCWLHAICNMHNFLKHLEGKKDDIVRNKGQRDTDDFDEVERFFNKPQFGFSMDKLKNVGGLLQEESDVLTKLEINHSHVYITIKKDSAQSRETAIKTAKTLLLKHFAASITPVLVNVKDDTVSCNVNNGSGAGHSLVVVGLDIGEKAVVVANSQCGDLQEYSLDRIASVICNKGSTGYPLVNIEMIFPSFTHQNNFYYDNNIHSWDEFKSQLLPAISKPL